VKVIENSELAPHQSWASPSLQLGALRPDRSGLAGAAWTRVSRRSDASAFLGAVLKFLGSPCAGCRLRSSSHRWLLYTIASILARGVWNRSRLFPGTWQRQGPQIRPEKEASKLFRPALGADTIGQRRRSPRPFLGRVLLNRELATSRVNSSPSSGYHKIYGS
jgi:hypothetical protein